MHICAVHIQVLQKSKTVCFTSCSKGTYVILPFEQKLWSSLPAEDDLFHGCVTHTLRVERYSKSQEKVAANPCVRRKKLLCGPFEEALDWSQGKPSRTVKQTDRNKRLFWCEEKSVTSAPQADVATGLTSGTYSSWRKVKFAIGADTQFIHCLLSSGGAGWRWERASRHISQPNCIRIQKYLRRKIAF